MKAFLKQEILFWILLTSQFLFLIYFGDKIPSEFPTHWDFNGNPDSYSNKYTFPILNTVIYLVLLFIPKVDPRKENYKLFSDSYFKIRFLLTLTFTLIFYGICLRYFGFHFSEAKLIFISVLSIITILGNYMRSFRPNYFVGIRTPWTLENETVWKKTHELGGKLFFYNGLIGIILCLFLDEKILPFIVFTLVFTASIIPVFYSYIYYRKIKKLDSGQMPDERT
jgi:uncharacterized membrane protein